MKVRYDRDVDAAYIQLSSKTPTGGVEIDEGVILHVTKGRQIVGIDILDASTRFPVRNLFRLQLELAPALQKRGVA